VVQTAIPPTNDGPIQAKKQKRLEKQSCFQCKQPGHLVDDCMVLGCDHCESMQHISDNCPLLSTPKPTITLYRYARE
jgi:hypothetical protein